MIYRRENYIHTLAEFAKLPRKHLATIFQQQAKELFPLYRSNEEFVRTYTEYNIMNYGNLSELGVAY